MPNHKGVSRGATSKDRLVQNRVLHRRILIVCEGIETEPNYFKALIKFHQLNGQVQNGTLLNLDVDGTGRNTLSLVSYAEKQQRSGAGKYDEIWCVFDKDSFPDDAFDNAIAKTYNHPYLNAAWTNESFEHWYILHFQYLDTSPAGSGGKPRDYYIERLKTLLKEHCQRDKYSKNDTDMYALLKSRLPDAIRNARQLKSLYADAVPYHQQKPATNVYELVEHLLEYASEIRKN